jgi:hypothetical protein
MPMMSVGRCVGVHARPLLSRRVRLGGVLVPTPPDHAEAAQGTPLGGLCRASSGEEDKSLSETKEPAKGKKPAWLVEELNYKLMVADFFKKFLLLIRRIALVAFLVCIGYLGITIIPKVSRTTSTCTNFVAASFLPVIPVAVSALHSLHNNAIYFLMFVGGRSLDSICDKLGFRVAGFQQDPYCCACSTGFHR